jgi:hypothetical protein
VECDRNVRFVPKADGGYSPTSFARCWSRDDH